MKTQDLIGEINDLPVDERVKVIDQVLENLHQPGPEVEQAWIKEVDQRARQVKEGKVEMISQEEFERMRREKK